MKKVFLIQFLLIFLILPLLVSADGGITISVKAPHSEKDIGIPSQEAIIVWDGEYQTMAISTGIKTKDLADLAWIIPVPSKTKPEVEKANVEIFQQVPYLFSEIKISSWGASVQTIFPLLIMFVLFSLSIFLWLRKKRSKPKLIIGVVLIMFFIIGIDI